MPTLEEIARALSVFRELAEAAGSSNQDALSHTIVTEQLLSDLTGFEVSRLETWRRRGLVTRGVHWFKLSTGAVVWDKQRFDVWVRTEASSQALKSEATELSESESRSAGAGNGKRRRTRPVLPDCKQRQGNSGNARH